jgi:hypothetical protein
VTPFDRQAEGTTLLLGTRRAQEEVPNPNGRDAHHELVPERCWLGHHEERRARAREDEVVANGDGLLDLEFDLLIKACRALGDLETSVTSTDQFHAADHLALLGQTFEGRTADLIEPVIDYQLRIEDFDQHWRRWRSKRAVAGRQDPTE